jgi:hypothetical protein
MKIKDWFDKWGITGLKLKGPFLEIDWKPQPEEQQAAWELYIELITRVATQPLAETEGDEIAALNSVYKLFDVTRSLLKEKGRKAETFSKIAIVILNQKIRPFTAEWHKNKNDLETDDGRRKFREDLQNIQQLLKGYAGLLADVAGVENFLELEEGPVS